MHQPTSRPPLSRALPLLAVALAFAFALAGPGPDAVAKGPVKKKDKKVEKKPAAPARTDPRAVPELTATANLLRVANVNYGGHRARAILDINQALAALGVKNPNPSFASTTAGRENQALSDRQLRKAHHQLKAVLQRLERAPAGNGHKAAIPPLKNAIRRLEAALRIA